MAHPGSSVDTPAARVPPQVPHEVGAYLELVRRGKTGPNSYVALLGLRSFDPARLVRSVEHGLSFRVLELLQKNLAMSTLQVTEYISLAPRTLSRRRKEGRLTPDESDKILRITRLFAKALTLFEGDPDASRRWLISPQRAVGGAIPLELAKTEVGAREVENLLHRAECGVIS